MVRSQHERVVGDGRCKLNITWYTFVGVYDRMYLDTAFFLSRLRMTPHALEDSIGKQCDSRGINDSELFYPLFGTMASAVRGKQILIGGIQIAIDLFKELF